MQTIEAENGVVTHINVFTVPREKQQQLIDSLKETVKAAREVPGWLSASIHQSFDGTQVVNYVQFESREAAQAVPLCCKRPKRAIFEKRTCRALR